MNSDARFYIKTLGFVVLFAAIIGYGLFTSRFLIEGPIVTIDSPKNGTTETSPLVEIDGTAQNITYITLDDRQIYIDATGHFSEKLLLQPGYSIIKVYAKDRFGRSVTKQLGLVYLSSSVPSTITNTGATTAATATASQEATSSGTTTRP